MFISLPPRSDMCGLVLKHRRRRLFFFFLYDVIPAGSVTRYCGSLTFFLKATFHVEFSSSIETRRHLLRHG